jgi:hypothetical protein
MNTNLLRKSHRGNWPSGQKGVRYWSLSQGREIYCDCFLGKVRWEVQFSNPWVTTDDFYIPVIVISRETAIEILKQEGIL